MTSASGPGWEVRLGRWQDVLADVGEVSSLITDPPYSARTHDGWNEGEIQVRDATGQATREAIAYDAFDDDGVAALVDSWVPRCRGWFVVMTSHDLVPAYESALRAHGRYVFAPVPVIQKRPRLLGDGPASWAVYLMASRPRSLDFMGWGCLPGAYEAPTVKGSGIAGAKPLGLMRAIVRDYSRPGDLVVDPFCGSGTTALACAMEGRRCVTAEVDERTYDLAVRRLRRGYTPDIFGGSE